MKVETMSEKTFLIILNSLEGIKIYLLEGIKIYLCSYTKDGLLPSLTHILNNLFATS